MNENTTKTINAQRVINFIETEIIREIEIESIDGLDVIQNKIDDIETSLENDLPETVKNMLNDELTSLNEKYNNTIIDFRNRMIYDVLRYAIRELDIIGKTNIPKTTKNGKNTKSANSEKSAYTAKMAIMENVSNDWQSLKSICDSIEKQDKLPSIHTNDGWKRTISTAMIGLIENGSVLRNDKHEYKLA